MVKGRMIGVICLPIDVEPDLPGSPYPCAHCGRDVHLPSVALRRYSHEQIHVMCPGCAKIYHSDLPVQVDGYSDHDKSTYVTSVNVTTHNLAEYSARRSGKVR